MVYACLPEEVLNHPSSSIGDTFAILGRRDAPRSPISVGIETFPELRFLFGIDVS